MLGEGRSVSKLIGLWLGEEYYAVGQQLAFRLALLSVLLLLSGTVETLVWVYCTRQESKRPLWKGGAYHLSVKAHRNLQGSRRVTMNRKRSCVD